MALAVSILLTVGGAASSSRNTIRVHPPLRQCILESPFVPSIVFFLACAAIGIFMISIRDSLLVWFVAGMSAHFLLPKWYKATTEWLLVRRFPHYCVSCGYDRSTLVDGHPCPECGFIVDVVKPENRNRPINEHLATVTHSGTRRAAAEVTRFVSKCAAIAITCAGVGVLLISINVRFKVVP